MLIKMEAKELNVLGIFNVSAGILVNRSRVGQAVLA